MRTSVTTLLFLSTVLFLSACTESTEHSEAQLGNHQDQITMDEAKGNTRSAFDNVTASISKAHNQSGLNSFIYLAQESALNAAKKIDASEVKGALHGMPFVVKDNIHVAGMPNSAGTLSFKDFHPDTSNAVVDALLNEGAIVLGKTNMHELAFGITSNNSAFGAVHNAINPELIAGGSSGGTAVAIASGIVAMGLGTDTGGSTRIPAALNGIAGFRPSLGRYNSLNVTPVSKTRDTVGPLAKSVSLIALMDSVITGEQCTATGSSFSGLRLGVPREYFYHNLSAEVRDNIESVLAKLKGAGVELVEVDMPGLEELNASVSFPVVLHEVMQELPAYFIVNEIELTIEQMIEQISSPDVKAVFSSQLGEGAIPEEAYKAAIEHGRPQLQKLYADAFSGSDVRAMIMPTTPLLATPIATSDETVELNGERVPTFGAFIRNTDPSSNAGIPSLVFPAGANASDNPFSVMLDGPMGSDCGLLKVGLTVEALLSQM